MHRDTPLIAPFTEDILVKSAKMVIDDLADTLCCRPNELVTFLKLSVDHYMGTLSIYWQSPGLKEHVEERNIYAIREHADLDRLIEETLDQLRDYLQPTVAKLKAANLEKIRAKEEAEWNDSLKTRLRHLRRLRLY
jgi:hypothetical protein